MKDYTAAITKLQEAAVRKCGERASRAKPVSEYGVTSRMKSKYL